MSCHVARAAADLPPRCSRWSHSVERATPFAPIPNVALCLCVSVSASSRFGDGCKKDHLRRFLSMNIVFSHLIWPTAVSNGRSSPKCKSVNGFTRLVCDWSLRTTNQAELSRANSLLSGCTLKFVYTNCQELYQQKGERFHNLAAVDHSAKVNNCAWVQ